MPEPSIPSPQENFVQTLVNKLPPFIARKEVHRLLGGLIASQTLSNADAAGKGPEGALRVGKSVVYDTESLARWIVKRFGVEELAKLKIFGEASR